MSKIYRDRVWKNEKYPQELLAETRQRCQVTCFRVAHEGGLPERVVYLGARLTTASCWLQVHPGEPPFDLELFYVKYRNLYVYLIALCVFGFYMNQSSFPLSLDFLLYFQRLAPKA